MSKKLLSIAAMLCAGLMSSLQAQPLSEKMAQTVIALWGDSMSLKPGKPATWIYEYGLVNEAMEAVWKRTGDTKIYKYIQKNIDYFVKDNGDIRTYEMDKFNIDNVAPGRSLLFLYNEGKDNVKEKYKKAAFLLRKQLALHPRTSDGGFWHKKVYPNQMWLDGLYMAEPFYAEFSSIFNEPANYDDIAKQFILMEKHSRDSKTGLLYHGWDESKKQKWADTTTGRSPNFWGRAMGWYAAALVDALDYFPKDHPQHDTLVAIFKRLSTAIVKFQDKESGVWYQVVDKGSQKGNYREASASSMYVYALLKGARKGYVDASVQAAAKRGYEGVVKTFIVTDEKGAVHLNGVCSVAGLGGNPYRDGSFEYYMSEKVVQDDPKGVGPFILASVEHELLEDSKKGTGATVGLDYYFNNEYKDGKRFHYTWEDEDDSGFSFWGNIFRDFGAKTVSVETAPTAENLKNLNVYIIVDPDTKEETAKPNFIDEKSIEAIAAWVNAGGKLVLMGNDSTRAEFENFNKLAAKFGIHFNENSKNKVKKDQYDMGKVLIPANDPIFKNIQKIFVKELSTLTVKDPAKAQVKLGDDIVIATASVGKGKVFAIGDPWLYNEYVDGKRIPMEFENFKAAKALALWLVGQPQTSNEKPKGKSKSKKK